jgi:hypothetical protein
LAGAAGGEVRRWVSHGHMGFFFSKAAWPSMHSSDTFDRPFFFSTCPWMDHVELFLGVCRGSLSPLWAREDVRRSWGGSAGWVSRLVSMVWPSRRMPQVWLCLPPSVGVGGFPPVSIITAVAHILAIRSSSFFCWPWNTSKRTPLVTSRSIRNSASSFCVTGSSFGSCAPSTHHPFWRSPANTHQNLRTLGGPETARRLIASISSSNRIPLDRPCFLSLPKVKGNPHLRKCLEK